MIQFILRIIKQLWTNFSSSSLIWGLSPVLTSDILLFTAFISLQRLNWFNLRVMKLISWWLLTVTVLQDCDHVSQTAEEFYTVRCQVADMKNIYVSTQNISISSENDLIYLPKAFHAFRLNILQKTKMLSFFFFCLCAGISGRGDHQRHVGGRQHVHLLPVWQEGPRREKVRRDLNSVCKIIFRPVR